MPKLLLAFAILLLAWPPRSVAAQQASPPVYLQIFYEGPGWLAGRALLHYSPAFRGKTEELVSEDSTKAMSPGALVLNFPADGTVYKGKAESVMTTEGSFVPGTDGKMRRQTPADVRTEQAAENARFTRGLNLLDARATLARNTLTKALNAAAADGWEVVQFTAVGTSGGLVYLLKRR